MFLFSGSGVAYEEEEPSGEGGAPENDASNESPYEWMNG